MKSIEITIRDRGVRYLLPFGQNEVKCRIKENGELSYVVYGNENVGNYKQILSLKKFVTKEDVNYVFEQFDELIVPLSQQVMFATYSFPNTIVLKENNKKLISVETLGEEVEVKNFYKSIENLLKCKFKLLNIKFENLI